MSASIPTPAEVKQKAEEVRRKAEEQIQQNIDEDIQTLIKHVRTTTDTEEPDKKGYYSFAILFGDVRYHDWELVFNQFIAKMRKAGYFIDIRRKPNYLKNSGKYIVTFRPS